MIIFRAEFLNDPVELRKVILHEMNSKAKLIHLSIETDLGEPEKVIFDVTPETFIQACEILDDSHVMLESARFLGDHFNGERGDAEIVKKYLRREISHGQLKASIHDQKGREIVN